MNIKKAAVYLFSGLYLALFSAACCKPHVEQPEGPKQEQQADAAPAVSEETAAAPAVEAGAPVVEDGAVAEEEMVEPAAEAGAVMEAAPSEEAAAPVPAAEGEAGVEEVVEEMPAAQ